MRRDEISDDLTELAFEFFYWFSRFESALKDQGHLESRKFGAKAAPSWALFEASVKVYVPSSDAHRLVALAPMTQVIGAGGAIEWHPTVAPAVTSDLGKVVLMLKTVRNNLFHGGKHGSAPWDDPARTVELLTAGLAVLDELARLASFGPDYDRRY
jgi:hypothetical protein